MSFSSRPWVLRAPGGAPVAAVCVLWLACGGGDSSNGSDGGGDSGKKDGFGLDGPVTDAGWPDCKSMPVSAKLSTIPQIWQDDPSMPVVETWISGVYVTAVSRGACAANEPCNVYVQQDLSYASLQAAAKHAIKVFASPATAQYFAGIAVGDKVDLLGWAWRYKLGGQNELLLQVNLALPGCFRKTGTGTATPNLAQLTDLTVNAYEYTLGPALVQVDGVSGTPQNPNETFGLYKTGMFNDGGIQSVVSLSPYFLPGGVFTGLTNGMKYNFTRVVGVFGLFVPAVEAGPATKYLEIYPRTSADIVQ